MMQIDFPQISLKAARVNANLTIREAAKRIGISPSTLIKWEKNPGLVNPIKQHIIERVYKYPSDYIFFGN